MGINELYIIKIPSSFLKIPFMTVDEADRGFTIENERFGNSVIPARFGLRSSGMNKASTTA
jgi:hypothetical protein